jgi:hypothetical protein
MAGRYPPEFRRKVLDLVASGRPARLQVRYPEVKVVFADSRRFAEEWTYRFLAAAAADAMAEGSG